MRSQFYQVNWSWNKDIDILLLKKFKNKTILNFPCGMSKIGLRADLDPSVNPDIMADLFYPQEHFKANSFDVVICDPPFKYFNKFKWLLEISNIASEYFVISTPVIFYSFKGFSDPEIIASRQKGNLFCRLLFIYKKLNQSL